MGETFYKNVSLGIFIYFLYFHIRLKTYSVYV